MSYNTLLTLAGRETVAQALSGGRPAAINYMAFGDAEHEPTGFETSLVHEVHRTTVTSVRIDPNNPTWVIVEAVIPTNIGGFNIREVGVFDTQGKMFAIANYPPVYKPLMIEGVARDLKVRLYLEVGGKQSVNLIMRNCCGDNVYVDGCNQDYPKIKEMTDWNIATATYLDRLTIGTGHGSCTEADCLALVDALAAYNTNTGSYLNVLEPCVPSSPLEQQPANPYPYQQRDTQTGCGMGSCTEEDYLSLMCAMSSFSADINNHLRILGEGTGNGAIPAPTVQPTASPTSSPIQYPTATLTATPTAPPLPQVGTDDIEITDPRKGLILRSPDGTRYRVTVQNNGALTTTKVE